VKIALFEGDQREKNSKHEQPKLNERIDHARRVMVGCDTVLPIHGKTEKQKIDPV